MSLRLLDVARPALMTVHRIYTQTDHFRVSPLEFRLEFRHVAELGSADRSEILGMRKQDSPRVSEPLVKFQIAFRGLSLEVGSGFAYAKRHSALLADVSFFEVRIVCP